MATNVEKTKEQMASFVGSTDPRRAKVLGVRFYAEKSDILDEMSFGDIIGVLSRGDESLAPRIDASFLKDFPEWLPQSGYRGKAKEPTVNASYVKEVLDMGVARVLPDGSSELVCRFSTPYQVAIATLGLRWLEKNSRSHGVAGQGDKVRARDGKDVFIKDAGPTFLKEGQDGAQESSKTSCAFSWRATDGKGKTVMISASPLFEDVLEERLPVPGMIEPEVPEHRTYGDWKAGTERELAARCIAVVNTLSKKGGVDKIVLSFDMREGQGNAQVSASGYDNKNIPVGDSVVIYDEAAKTEATDIGTKAISIFSKEMKKNERLMKDNLILVICDKSRGTITLLIRDKAGKELYRVSEAIDEMTSQLISVPKANEILGRWASI